MVKIRRERGRRGGLDEVSVKGSAHAATALRTVGIEFFRISFPAGPRSVIGTDCHPVTSGMSERLMAW